MGPNDIIACSGSVDCAADDIRGFMDAAGAGPRGVVGAADRSDRDPIRMRGTRRCRSSPPSVPTSRCGIGRTFASPRAYRSPPTTPISQGASQYLQRSTLIADDVTEPIGGFETHRCRGRRHRSAVPSYQYQPVPPNAVVDTRVDGPANLGRGHADRGSVGARADAGRHGCGRCCRQCHFRRPGDRRVPHGVSVRDRAAAGVERQLPRRPGPRRTGDDVAAPTGSRAVRLQQHGHRRRRRSARRVRADAVGCCSRRSHRIACSTRANTGRFPTIAIQAPPGASAVAATLTVTGSNFAGFLTAYPCSAASSGRFERQLARRAKRSPARCSCRSPPTARSACSRNAPVDVIVDITGVFSGAGNLRFTPVATDTDGRHQSRHRRMARASKASGQTIEIGAAPDAAVAVTGTITMVDPGVDGYLTGTICGQPAGATSSVNGARASVMANSLTVGLSPGGNLCITSLVATHTLFDTTGWWTASASR